MMLGSFGEKLETELFVKYKKQMDRLLDKILGEVSKLAGSEDMPPEIAELIEQIQSIAQVSDQSEYMKFISKINKLINDINTKYIFDQAEVNNYFYLCQRSLNRLSALAYAQEGVKFANLAINPRGGAAQTEAIPPEKSNLLNTKYYYLDLVLNGLAEGATDIIHNKLPLVGDQTLGKGANIAAEEMTRATIADVVVSLNLGLSEKVKTTKVSKKPKPSNQLKDLLGEKVYEIHKSSYPITDIANADLYASEQIYGQMFETLFMQIATMQDILVKIHALYEHIEDKKERENKIEAELINYGFKELVNPKVEKLMDGLSRNLGFNSSQELYRVYQQIVLNRSDGAQVLLDKKREFINLAKDTTAEKNPYDLIVQKLTNHYGKMLDKINESQFTHGNSSYISLMAFLGSDFCGALNQAFQIKSVGKGVMEGYLVPNRETWFGYAAGKLIDFGLGMANPSYLDSIILGTYHAESQKLFPFIRQSNQEINEAWLEKNVAHVLGKIQDRQNHFKTPFSEEKTKEALLKKWNEHSASGITSEMKDRSKKYKKEGELQQLKDYYFANKRSVFASSTPEVLTSEIKIMSDAIQANNLAISEKQDELLGMRNEIQMLEGKERRSLNPMKAIRNLFRAFGAKSVSESKRRVRINTLKGQIEKTENEIRAHQINNTVAYQTRSSAKSILSQKTKLEGMEQSQIIQQFYDAIDEQNRAYERIVGLFAISGLTEDNINLLYDAQNELLSAMSHTTVYIHHMIQEIAKYTIDQLESIYQSLEAVEIMLEAWQGSLSCLGEQQSLFQNQLEQLKKQTYQTLQEKRKLAEIDKVAQMQASIFDYYSHSLTAEISDPYSYFKLDNPKDFNSLSADSQAKLLGDANKHFLGKIKTDNSLETYQVVSLYQKVLTQGAFSERFDQEKIFYHGYADLKIELKNILKEQYQNTNSDNLATLLNDLLQQGEKAVADASYLETIQASWWYNPIGSITTEDVQKGKDKILAYQRQLELILPVYHEKMQLIIKDKKQLLSDADSHQLNALYGSLVSFAKQAELYVTPAISDNIQAISSQLRYYLEPRQESVEQSKSMFFGYVPSDKSLDPLGGVEKIHAHVAAMFSENSKIPEQAEAAFKRMKHFTESVDDSQIPAYEKGWWQRVVDNDAHYLQQGQNLYTYAEFVLKALNKKFKHAEPSIGEEVIEKGELPEVIVENEKTLRMLDKIMDTLTGYLQDRVENPQRLNDSIAKWRAVLTPLRQENQKAIEAFSTKERHLRVVPAK